MALSKEEFGRRVRAAREAADLTQDQVAKALGVNWATYQRWETGKFHPRPNHLIPLARVLAVEPEHLTGVDGHADTALERLVSAVEANSRLLRELRVVMDGLVGSMETASGERSDILDLLGRQDRVLTAIERAVASQEASSRLLREVETKIAAGVDELMDSRGRAANPPRSKKARG